MGAKPSVIEGTHTENKGKHIQKIFEEMLNEKCKNRTALFYHDLDNVCETSFDELNKNANRLAACLLQHLNSVNAKPNQDGDYVIAVCMKTNEIVIAILLAIWKIGAAYVTIERSFPRNRVEHILFETNPILIIYDQYDDLNVLGITRSMSFDELLVKSIDFSDENIHSQKSFSRGDEDIAIISYTSGSTGTPKGVRIPHSAVINKLRWLQRSFPYTETEKVGVLISALINVDSISEVWSPLLNGVALLIIPQEVTEDPSKLVAVLELYKVERIGILPSLLTSLLVYLSWENNRLGNLKTWICSGDNLTSQLAKEFFNYFDDGTHRLCNFYGSTEVMGDVTFYVCENMEQLDDLSSVPIGYPVDNTAIFILNDDLNPAKLGDSGEIFVSGLNLAKGYVSGREKSKFIFNRFTDNEKFQRLYRTGDFGRIIKENCILFEGRNDSQIKVRGQRVDIREVEKMVQSLEQVNNAIVLCYHAGKSDQAIIAFVTLKNEVNESKQGHIIEESLRSKLIDYQVPHVKIIETIPLLPNGKIDRRTLLKGYENNCENTNIHFDYAGIPDDQLKMAKEVFEVIGEVIGHSIHATISIQSNFYELGGTSLNSVYAVTQLRDKGYYIGVTDFITANCLGEILNRISCGRDELAEEDDRMHFKVLPLTTHHKHITISIITSSFYEKCDLGMWLKPHIRYTDCKDIVEQTWEYILEKDISFAITDSKDNIIGVAINFDGQDEPKITLTSKLMIIFEFLDELERPVKEKQLPQGKNKVFHSILMGTSAQLTPQQNVAVIQKMEEENLCLAKRKGFAGILATNTNPLVQQLGCNFYGYRALADYPINQYIHHDGSKPFAEASDSQHIIVNWKDIIHD